MGKSPEANKNTEAIKSPGFNKNTETEQSPETNHDAFITAQTYLAERAMAATEYISRGKQEKITAVMDFEGTALAMPRPC